MEISVNYLALLLAGIASMVVGFLWYGPILGKQWMQQKGYTEEQLKQEQATMGPWYGVSFVLALITAFVLNHVIAFSLNFYNYGIVATGLTSAFYMWLGFMLPVQTTNQIFGEKKWKLLAIDTGYQLITLLTMGVLLGLLWS